MTHNMLNLFRKAILEPMGITEIGLRNIVRKLIHVPAKVIKEMPSISLLFPDKHFYTLKCYHRMLIGLSKSFRANAT